MISFVIRRQNQSVTVGNRRMASGFQKGTTIAEMLTLLSVKLKRSASLLATVAPLPLRTMSAGASTE